MHLKILCCRLEYTVSFWNFKPEHSLCTRITVCLMSEKYVRREVRFMTSHFVIHLQLFIRTRLILSFVRTKFPATYDDDIICVEFINSGCRLGLCTRDFTSNIHLLCNFIFVLSPLLQSPMLTFSRCSQLFIHHWLNNLCMETSFTENPTDWNTKCQQRARLLSPV